MSALRRIPQQYLWPLLLLILLCLGSIATLLYVTTSSQDRMEEAREKRTLAVALDARVDMIDHDLQDYAIWDEAVRHVARGFSATWIDDNITAYLGRRQGYDHVFVVAPDGHTRYAFSKGRGRWHDAIATLGPGLGTSVAALRRPRGGFRIEGGFTRRGDNLFAYSAATIMPLSDRITAPAGGRYVLIIAERVDAAFLDRVRDANQLPPITLVPPGAESRDIVMLRDRAGNPLAQLAMPVRRPGTDLRNRMLPGLLLIIISTLGITLVVLRRGAAAIAALRAAQARVLHTANHDPLTALPNRRVLLERVARALRDGREVSLLYMDLDGFKEVNDLYGHHAGDDLLRAVTARIRAAAGATPLIARMGGDEFAVLHQYGDGDALVMAERIIAAFRETFAIGGANVLIGVSIGVVTSTDAAGTGEGCNVDELMRRSDIAMYSAKAHGKNRWAAYAPSMDESHAIRKRLEHDLRAAILADQIDVAYQPIVASDGGAVVCVEALARWMHPREGAIPPDVFIPLAEITGLVGALGEQVLAKACRTVAPLGLDLSVNLSPAQFWDAHLVRTIGDVLAREGFPPERLELEITENYLMRRPDAAAGVIEELRSLGIRLALDDFGTGFASVGYLRQLCFDRLKIDKQFVAEATRECGAAQLFVSIVALGRSLRLEVTAEGVETEEQAALVRASGCHRMQGWLYGRPMPAADLVDAIRPVAALSHG